MKQQRVRVRFAKQGDLKLIGHRDLVRALERLFRRIRAPLAMSQGFHPRPLMTFPDALAIGIAADNEVMDIALVGHVDPHDLRDKMNAAAPPGLIIHEVQLLGDNDRKVKMQRMNYALEIPPGTDIESIEQQICRLKSQATLLVNRKEKQVEVSLTETLEGLFIDEGHLQMCIRVGQRSQLQPRDILAAIGLHDVLREGANLTRTQIELTT